MRETHYIDTDEEIITAVSRLRHSGQAENVFVFPKRALILQSIVNLRLLEREAVKLGKKIIVMTQDEAGRKLAEKAGLVIEEYRDRSPLQSKNHPVQTESVVETLGMPPIRNTPPSPTPTSDSLGSESFFAGAPVTVPAPTPTPPQTATHVAVRNASPVRIASLNSMRGDVLPPQTSFRKNVLPAAASIPQPLPVSPPPLPNPVVASAPTNTPAQTQGRLGRFMETKQGLAKTSLPKHPQEQIPLSTDKKPLNSPKNFHWGFVGLVILLIGGVVGGGWYVLFPKAIVTLEPQSAEQVVRLQLSGVVNQSEDSDSIPVRIWGIEKSLRVTESATGVASGNESAKARGVIRIYNDFSKESQPLVATTRFETPEGKIYRLAQGVVVPGMTEKDGKLQRGMVEATVVADVSGEQYNISPTRFSIPGFKGSPKYEKFTAESLQAFTGGSSSGSTNQTVVSNEDSDRAAAKALEQVKAYVLNEVKTQLKPGEVAIEDSIQLLKVGESMVPPLGGNTANFEYEGRYDAKVFIVQENLVRERIDKERVTTSGVTLVPKNYDIRYTSLLPKYDSGRMDMTIESTVFFQAELNTEQLKKALLGLDEEGIRDFLKTHPEIERLQVEFKPQLLISTLPKKVENVTLEVLTSKKAEH